MKALFISNDPKIFISNSAARARMRAYALAIGELHILSAAPRGTLKEVDGPLTLHPVSNSKIRSLFEMLHTARNIIQTHAIDVVSAQDPFEYGFVAMLAARNTRAALHIQIHTDFLSPWFVSADGFRAPKASVPVINKIRRRIASVVLRNADGIRAVSKRVAESIQRTYGTTVPIATVLPIAVDVSAQTAVPLPPHSFSFSLITVARLEYEKRIQDILYAIARIQQLYPSLGLFIVGKGSERRGLETLAKKLGLSDKVVFLGERGDARGLMKSAHAYIQASAYEGYGRTLIEAALARIPIITTDVGIVGEVFIGYEDVLSAPVADPAQLAVHISGLIEDHQARLALAINADKKARDHLEFFKDLPRHIADDLLKTIK